MSIGSLCTFDASYAVRLLINGTCRCIELLLEPRQHLETPTPCAIKLQY